MSLKESATAASSHNANEAMRMAPLASQLAPLVNCPKLSGGGGGEGSGAKGDGGGAEGRTHTQAQSDVQPTVDWYVNIRESDEN